MTLYNLGIITYPHNTDLLHPGDMPIENFIPQTFCLGFILNVTFGPVGHNPVGHVCLGLQITEYLHDSWETHFFWNQMDQLSLEN